MVRREKAGLCVGADSFQQLRELSIERMSFFKDIELPHTLESVVFRSVHLWGAMRLDKCKCVTNTPLGCHVLGSCQLHLWLVIQLSE